MKIVCSIFFILFWTVTVKGQGNLQFNSVKYIKFDKTFPSASSGTDQLIDSIVVVPVGKVWKIESSRSKLLVNLGVGIDHACSTLDGIDISENRNFSTGGSTQTAVPGKEFQGPIWLPSGSYKFGVRFFQYNDGQGRALAFFSIVEFNVVQ